MPAPLLSACCWLLALTASAVAAVTDMRAGRIPNWLTGAAIALGTVLNGALGGWQSLGLSLLGLALTILVPAGLYQITHGSAIGGGDVKLLAALGAILGPALGLEAEFLSFGVLVLFALIELTYQGRLIRTLGNAMGLLVSLVPGRKKTSLHADSFASMRMGPAMAVAVWLTFVSEQFLNLGLWLR